MTVAKSALILIYILAIFLLAGCADKGSEVPVTFAKAGEYTDRRGQASIKLYTYAGEAEEEDIKDFASTLGCGMLYTYFYPAATDTAVIPVEELRTAKSFVHAQEILFQGEGYARWDFASVCLGIIPTLSDCRESSISTNCR